MTRITENGIMLSAGDLKDRQIGAVIVNYNTPGIISRAVNSIYRHVHNVLIIDNSDENNPAFAECDGLSANQNVWVIHTHENVGHGKGLNLGISCLLSDYIITMDSDATLLEPSIIKVMADMVEDPEVYGAGLVIKTSENGRNKENGIDYLHPYFAMVKRSVFFSWPLFINHGAPWIKTMKMIHGKLKLAHIPDLLDYCSHEHRRTREIAGTEWMKNWDNP